MDLLKSSFSKKISEKSDFCPRRDTKCHPSPPPITVMVNFPPTSATLSRPPRASKARFSPGGHYSPTCSAQTKSLPWCACSQRPPPIHQRDILPQPPPVPPSLAQPAARTAGLDNAAAPGNSRTGPPPPTSTVTAAPANTTSRRRRARWIRTAVNSFLPLQFEVLPVTPAPASHSVGTPAAEDSRAPPPPSPVVPPPLDCRFQGPCGATTPAGLGLGAPWPLGRCPPH
jgi:hypothetical protein